MIKLLNKPYPFYFTLKRSLILAIAIGIFIGIVYFLLMNQSFSGKYAYLSRIQKTLSFSLITFGSIMLVFELFTKYFISDAQKENWTIGKQFGIISLLLLVITIFNFIFLLFIAKDIFFFLSAKFITSLVLTVLLKGLLPSFVIVWLDYTIKLKENLKQSLLNNENLKKIIRKEIDSDKDETIIIHSENRNESVQINLKNLLFIKADGNYIEVVFTKNGHINKTLYRASIQTIENKLKDFPYIIRTHRSFIVNVRKINYSKGTARNYQLFFPGIEESVPVARNRFREFSNTLSNMPI